MQAVGAGCGRGICPGVPGAFGGCLWDDSPFAVWVGAHLVSSGRIFQMPDRSLGWAGEKALTGQRAGQFTEELGQ